MTANTSVSWPGGYAENVKITNSGPAVTNWNVTFGLPSNERVTASWNVTHSQTGQVVTAQPVSYDKTIPAGAALPFGFNASDPDIPAQPTWYALNGVRCSG